VEIQKQVYRTRQLFFKLPLKNIRDIACGQDFSMCCDNDGVLYTFGHPQDGQLGFGTTGQFIKDGGKGANMQFRCVNTPKRVEKFVTKDSHGKVIKEHSHSTVFIKSVACGKNHSLCLEDSEREGSLNRMFSFGFGGYGRLGHNCSDDEYFPREINIFSQYEGGVQGKQILNTNPQKQIVQIYAGSTFSLAISKSKHLYFWGKMSNSPRGESQVYPKLIDELYDWPVRACAAGSNCVFVASKDACIAWGAPVAGKFGFEGDVKGSTHPKFIASLQGQHVSDVSCGYGHVSFVVDNMPEESIKTFPKYPYSVAVSTEPESSGGSSKKRKSTTESSTSAGVPKSQKGAQKGKKATK